MQLKGRLQDIRCESVVMRRFKFISSSKKKFQKKLNKWLMRYLCWNRVCRLASSLSGQWPENETWLTFFDSTVCRKNPVTFTKSQNYSREEWIPPSGSLLWLRTSTEREEKTLHDSVMFMCCHQSVRQTQHFNLSGNKNIYNISFVKISAVAN